MRRLLSWLHYLLLLLVLAVLILVSALRVGVHSHPLYHQELENWLSSVLQQPIAIADFTLHLQGRELAIDINGASLGQDDLALLGHLKNLKIEGLGPWRDSGTK